MTRMMHYAAVGGLILSSAVAHAAAPVRVAFSPSFGQGFAPMAPDAVYDAARGYGFEPAAAVRPAGDSLFSFHADEGNYRVTVWLGDDRRPAATAIKAESRRVMLPLTRTAAGETKKVEFVVNVHTPRIDAASSVKISDREQTPSVRHWDDKLTLEFCGDPAVRAVQVERDDKAVTVFIAGDSTVCDQPKEPWAAWGQLLPEFFGPNVAVANYAESGRSFKSFTAEHRWDKIVSQIRPGDYVLIQFGHNDMKDKAPDALAKFAESTRAYVTQARAKGATVVLLTPMHRRKFVGNEIQPTFGDYPDATRKVAAELKVPLIDLQLMSKPLYEFFGPDKSKLLFVHAPANTYPGQDKPLADDTHFKAFGADQIARCVVQGLRDLYLPLAADLRDGIPAYDPHHPNDPAAYDLPASEATNVVTPEGR